MTTVWIYVDTSKEVGDLDHLDAPRRLEVEAFNRADPFAKVGIWEMISITGFLRRQGWATGGASAASHWLDVCLC
jgi:hypothetical protein